MRWLNDLIGYLFGRTAGPEVHYQGDVYDTPPAIIRVAMSLACLFGAILMAYHLYTTGQQVSLIIGTGLFLIAIFLIWTVPRAWQTTLATALFWAVVGAMVLILPL